MAKKNLIMGTGSGYNWYTFEPFVASFVRNASENADLVLFVDNISEYTRDRLTYAGGEGAIILQPFTEYAKSAYIINTRWKMFFDYLNEHGDEYEQVLTTDTRDVIFQGDVFKEFENNTSYLGYCTEFDNIRGEKTGVDLNYHWIAESFGKNEADKLKDKTVLCCGTVIGTTPEIKIFLSKMLEYMPGKQFHGVDQATYQYLIYNNLLPIDNLIKIDCMTGAILTTGMFHRLNPMNVDKHLILRGDGGVPAVVHQYTSNEPLIRSVDEFYRNRNIQFDSRFTDLHSVFDQLKQLSEFGNLNDILKIFINHLLGKTDFAGQDKFLINILNKVATMPKSYEVELLEIAIQHALISALSKGFMSDDIDRLFNYTKKALDNNLTISTMFRKFVYACLLHCAKFCMQNNNMSQAVGYTDAAIMIVDSPDQELYLLQTEIYRKLGRNEESLNAYKKVLNLN